MTTTALCLGARVLDRKTRQPGHVIEEVPFGLAGIEHFYRIELDDGSQAWPRQAKDLERME
jgi:hypothetical protein